MKKKLTKASLVIQDLHVILGEKIIIDGIDLTINPGELHVIMGPNGSGKSTLTAAIMGHPAYKVNAAKIMLGSKNLLEFPPEERARAGLLLAFQNPIAVPGVTILNLLKTAYHEMHPDTIINAVEFYKLLKVHAEELGIPDTFLRRAVHDGFSGGEKKKIEMLQLLILKPKFVMLDEIDTGLDVDALKLVSQCIGKLQKAGSGILLITHYQRILNHINPGFVHVLKSGRIVKQGGFEVVKAIEEKGYAAI